LTISDEDAKRFLDMRNGKTKPFFPNGKIDETDEGQGMMAMTITPDRKFIRLEFPKPMIWMALSREETNQLILLLKRRMEDLLP